MRQLVGVGVVVMLATGTTSAQRLSDLAGRWKLDASQTSSAGGGGTGRGTGGGRGGGGGLGLGPIPDELSVSIEPSTVTITEFRGNDITTFVLALGGKPMPRQFAAGDASSVSLVKAGRYVTFITLPGVRVGGEKLVYEETRYVDERGALIVDIRLVGAPNTRHAVYTKVR